MRALLSTFLVVICLLSVGAEYSFFPELPVPVFLWGSSEAFADKNLQYTETICTRDVSDFLTSFKDAKSNPNNPLAAFRKEGVPEVVIMWLENTDLSQYHNLAPVIESAGSSLIIVNNYRQQGKGLNDSIATMGWKYVSVKDLAATLQSGQILSDNKPDFLAVTDLSKYNNNERATMLRAVDTQLKEQSGSYIWIATAEAPMIYVEQRASTIQSQLNIMHNSPVFTYIDSKYWPKGVWEGLLVAALLILLLLLGVGCTASVQSPTRWENPDKPRRPFTELNEP